jgi:outer membrane protein
MKTKFYVLIFFSFGLFPLMAQDSLSLFDVISAGLLNNYSIIIEQNNAQIATNNNTIGNAGFLPTIEANAGQNYTISTTNSKYLTGAEKNVQNATGKNFNAGVVLDWTLFDGFRMFISKDMLETLDAMGQTQARIAVESTIGQIIITYFGIVQEKKLVQALREAAQLSLDRKRIADAKISIGSGSKLMLLQSTVDLNTDSTRLLKEITALKNLKADLNLLIGREPEIFFDVTDTINLTHVISYDDLLTKTLTGNAELMMARNDQYMAELAVKNARSDRYPRLSFSGGYSYAQLNSQSGFLEYNKAYGPNYGFTLSYRLFDGFNINRNIKNAEIESGSSIVRFRQTDIDIRSQLYKMYNEYLLNLDVVALEKTNRAVAKENVEVALEKYKLGSISDIDLREIQNKYLDSQYQLLLSEFQAKQAEIQLMRISGDLYQSLEQ